MRRFDFIALSSTARIAALSLVLALGGVAPAVAQTPAAPPPAPRLPGGGAGANFDSGSFLVTSAANEHEAFLWVIDSVQRTVMLCEKTENAKDFTCTKKPLP